VQETAKKILALRIDPETPESFMLRPKRRRWENPTYTRWVKAQQCVCCKNPADDPHHLSDMDKEGWEPKPMIYSCCRCAEHITTNFIGTLWLSKPNMAVSLTLLFRFLDHALAIGVLA
jgi:hypothetical protein